MDFNEKKLIFGTGVSSAKDHDGLYVVIKEALKCGIMRFDTAPSYKTEKILGEVLTQCCKELNISREQIYIQTKIDPWQMIDGNISGFVDDVLKKMKLDYLDAVLIHWPLIDELDRTWKQLVQIRDKSAVKRVGICNVRSRHLKQVLYYDTIPDIIQIERNPLNTCEKEIDICKKAGMEVQAYSPLCKMDARIKNSELLAEISEKYKKNIGQIVLRWHINTGVVPIFTSKKSYRIREYSEIFDFDLNDTEIKDISALNENYKMYLESVVCAGF